MKNLMLIRHAKSSWDDPNLSDLDRPLNKRGKTDAPTMGAMLLARELHPDRIISSPAKRALKTAKILAESLGYPKKKIDVHEAIYFHGLDDILDLIKNLEKTWERVYLVGHNPEITALANRLSNVHLENIPTCGIVSLSWSTKDWEDTIREHGKLEFFERPPKHSIVLSDEL